MKNRGFILPALTGFAVSALFIFMSCAGQESTGGDPLEELGQETAAAPTEGEAPPSEDAGLTDLGTTEEAAKQDNTGLPSEEEMAKTVESEALGDIPTEKVAEVGDQPVAPPQEDLSKDAALNDGDVLGLPSDADIAKVEQQEKVAEVGELTLNDGPAASAPQKPWGGVSHLPTIPQAAFKRKGESLNRFYFVRKGDTPASVSELIYGSSNKAKKLKAWNKGAWKPGKLIFYASAQSPDDTQMQSFYKERGIQNGEYTIKRGDWLSKVAKQLLGHAGSWKEIAIINGLSSADAIEKGQHLAVYPADLRSGTPVASAETPSPTAVPTGTPAQTATPDQFQADSGVQFAPPVPNGGPNKKVAKKGGMDALLILKQEWITILFAAIVVVFMGALVLVNKRRKARRAAVTEDATDDIFGAGGQ
jgi:nucleoid-associated protein YgaU